MRNLIFTFSVLFCVSLNAQTDTYARLKNLIRQTHPEIITEDKLIAFNVWSAGDMESREANKSFDRAYSVYEYAKLKGGPRGIVVVTINKDNLSGMATIAYTRDGAHKLISVAAESIEGMDLQARSNAIFDSSGNEIYKNLPASKIFSSVNQLITR
ncbi:MAG: hypothetical protein V4635_15500 [Bacteroidota bacterium]